MRMNNKKFARSMSALVVVELVLVVALILL